MKYGLLLMLITLTVPSVGQELESLIFRSQQADEPPTAQGQPKYVIGFVRRASGELLASHFFKDKAQIKLKYNLTVDKETVEKVTEWRRSSKRTFSQSDLQLDISALRPERTKYKLNFDIPTNFIVSIDSFQFCQTYKTTRTISTGGETISVTFIFKDGQRQEFAFRSDDVDGGSINLIQYIWCYALLADKIPGDVPGHVFFSKDKFFEIVFYYLATVECEGFYYKEFTDKNLHRTPADNRSRKDWDFVEYMKGRATKD